eukprot:2404508-Rhodomonas_salina.1
MPVLYMPNCKVKWLVCPGCKEAKATGSPGQRKQAKLRATAPLERVFMDLAGPVTPAALGGY